MQGSVSCWQLRERELWSTPCLIWVIYLILASRILLAFKLTFQDVSLLSRAANSIQEGWFSCEGCFLSLKSQAGGFSGSSSEHLQHSFRFESLSKKSIFFWILLQSHFSFSKRTRSCETNSNLEVGFAFLLLCSFIFLLPPNITSGLFLKPLGITEI